MNIKISQPSAPQEKSETPSSQTGSGQSDTKEILLLASGLLVLVFGIGGLLMYSEEEPLPATASQGSIGRKWPMPLPRPNPNYRSPTRWHSARVRLKSL